jgi:uncharacterized protein YdeI (YjbR/CyaY-like superfamily)
MKNFAKVQIESRTDLRLWLSQNQGQQDSIWLVTFKKGKGPYVCYDDIVEEAICFGWIDSRVAKLDEARSMLLLSPRRRASAWSKVNKDRVEKLTLAGLITPSGQALIDQAKLDGTWDKLNEVDALIVPDDLRAAFTDTLGAQENWERFPPSSKRGILEWINAAKKVETRQNRVQQTASLAAQGIKANFPEGRNRLPPKAG